MKEKFLPQRTCAACRKKQDRSLLFRITKIGEEYYYGNERSSDGRGVYVCKNLTCAKELKKRKCLSHTFKCPVPDEVYDKIISAIEETEVKN